MASEYIEDKHRLKGVRAMLLIITTISALVTVVLGIISSFLENSLPIYVHSLVASFMAYIIPIFIYAKTNNVTAPDAKERFYLQRCRRLFIPLVALMGVGWQFVMGIVNLPLNLIFGGSEAYYINSFGEFLLAVVVIAVIPAIFEEFLFRGIVYGSMAEINPKAAMIFSSAMFALLHADACNFIGYFLMGLVLAEIVSRTGSLATTIIFHLANNITALLFVYFGEEMQYEPVLTIILFVSLVVVFVGTYAYLTTKTKRPKPALKMATSQLLGQSFISVPVILCVVVLVVTAIIVRAI